MKDPKFRSTYGGAPNATTVHAISKEAFKKANPVGSKFISVRSFQRALQAGTALARLAAGGEYSSSTNSCLFDLSINYEYSDTLYYTSFSLYPTL